MEDAPFAWEPEPGRLPLLVVEDAPDAQYFYEKVLRSSAYQIYPAYTLHEAESALQQMLPAAVVLDIVLGPEDVWGLLVRLRRDERTHKIADRRRQLGQSQREGARARRRRLPAEAHRSPVAARRPHVTAGAHDPAAARPVDRRRGCRAVSGAAVPAAAGLRSPRSGRRARPASSAPSPKSPTSCSSTWSCPA